MKTYRERYEGLVKALKAMDNRFESDLKMSLDEYDTESSKIEDQIDSFWLEVEKLAEYKAMYEGLCK